MTATKLALHATIKRMIFTVRLQVMQRTPSHGIAMSHVRLSVSHLSTRGL